MGNMKFKIGDRVLIKSLDWYYENKDILSVACGNFTPDMIKYCGKIVTISAVLPTLEAYHIKEDGGMFNWTDEMFECKVEEKFKPKFKVGDKVKDKNNRVWFIVRVNETFFDISSAPNSQGYFVPIEDQDDYELISQCYSNDIEQILIPEGISDKLKGKTIEKTSFYANRRDSDENHLVITFTDGTYISVVIDYDDHYYLSDYIPELSCYSADAIGYISEGEFHYRKYYKQLIDIGAVKPLDEDFLKENILENDMAQELREYVQYERLKKKFENYNPREKYGIK